jgi:Protein of unknown function (DUF3078)
MQYKKLFTLLLILISISILAETNPRNPKNKTNAEIVDSIRFSIDYLKKHMEPAHAWQVENPNVLRMVTGLIHFAEDERIDSILIKLNDFQKNPEFKYLNRSPMEVRDSLQISGFFSNITILEKMKKLDRAIWNGVDLKTIPLPENLASTAENKIKPIEEGNEAAIIRRTHIVLPDSLMNVLANPDSLKNIPNDFSRIRKRKEARTQLLEQARLQYNSKVNKMNLDSAATAYRHYAVRVFSDSLQKHLRDSLKIQNLQILVHYNDSVVRSVNDSINRFVQTLQRYADNDSVQVWIHSLTGKPTQLWLRNNRRSVNRMYIKNVQNDSLRVQFMNIDKHALGIAIEDDVSFSRIEQKQRRDFVFDKFTPEKKLTKIKKAYDVIAPWDYGGNGNLGFSQTYLNNWKAGGNSAFAFLIVLKGYANYTNSKLKWENSGEVRNGWIRQGGNLDQTQKNDDKFELISRLGFVAYKNWYYSTEIDFQTQFFNGYNYPDKTKLISTIMSPAKTMFKLGLDYKPNNNFSLFLSPFTAKYVFVSDTARVDQTRFGVSANSQSYWEPGLNTDLRYKIEFNPRISFETKYKMFINYMDPFKKVDVNWENNFVAHLTDRINLTLNLYWLYDSNVTFPTGKTGSDGKEIYEPKLQTKELMTIGFAYKLTRHVYARKKLN